MRIVGGVVHRDVKPENILLHEGGAMVADFGTVPAGTFEAWRVAFREVSMFADAREELEGIMRVAKPWDWSRR